MVELQKVTGLGGILGEQLYNALNSDVSGLLGRNDFVEGISHLCIGGEEGKLSVLFEMVDFNRKGYATIGDFRSIIASLPTNCHICGQVMVQFAGYEDLLADLFREAGTHSYQTLWENRAKIAPLTRDIINTVVNSLPTVLFDIMGITDQLICTNPHSVSPVSEGKNSLSALKYDGRSYFFSLRKQCLFGYTSLSAKSPKFLIFTKDLFVFPVAETGFELRNCATCYSFSADSTEERDLWVENISKDQNFRWFDDFYEIGELLGEGGQAKVWKAASRGSGQAAAVKIIGKEGLQLDKEARLRTEISIFRLINHPNVLRLYDVFETSERLYLVTEELSEGTLFTWLQQRNFEANESFAKSIIIDIASGLLCLHNHGIVHRDVKLENVMLRHTRGGRLEGVLIDFGLSCFLGPEQRSTEPVGTLKYAAPEVLSRIPYGCKVDCWSLGVILCILLTGRMPFYGKSEQDIAMKILKQTVKLSSTRWATISPEAKAVVQGLLTKKQEERWSPRDVLHSQWLAEDFALVEKTTQIGKF